ncbi:putative lysosomal Pro-Xaa carboxypeptidase [Helianthus anomalus]
MISKMSRPPLLTLALISMLIGASINATRTNTPRLSILTDKPNYESLTPDFVSYNYTQTLDHFNYKPESNTTFQQRYIVNSKYWGGPITSSPIFVYMGAEVDITHQVLGVGFFPVLASRFHGLMVYIEHRYYGTSMPFGSEEEAYKDANSLGFFSSEQALADYAQIILHLKQDLSAENCPVIVVGGSYGGMLASWFRLKYPHMAYGALAASAPILYFKGLTPENGYDHVVSNDFNVSKSNI